jgi:hypothetical protein
MKLELTIISIFIGFSFLFGQSEIISKSQSELDKRLSFTKEVEGKMSQLKSENLLMTTKIEGEYFAFDSLRIEAFEGGYSNYILTNVRTDERLKVTHNSTKHFNNNDSISGNSERIEITIYYRENLPYLAIYNERHYNSVTTLLDNRFYVCLPNSKTKIEFSHKFQNELIDYLLEIGNEVHEIDKK